MKDSSLYTILSPPVELYLKKECSFSEAVKYVFSTGACSSFNLDCRTCILRKKLQIPLAHKTCHSGNIKNKLLEAIYNRLIDLTKE